MAIGQRQRGNGDCLAGKASANVKELSSALVSIPSHILAISADNYLVPTERNGEPEFVFLRPVAGNQLGSLAPGGIATNKNIGRTGVGVGCKVYWACANNDLVTAERDSNPEPVLLYAIAGKQSLRLRPFVCWIVRFAPCKDVNRPSRARHPAGCAPPLVSLVIIPSATP